MNNHEGGGNNPQHQFSSFMVNAYVCLFEFDTVMYKINNGIIYTTVTTLNYTLLLQVSSKYIQSAKLLREQRLDESLLH